MFVYILSYNSNTKHSVAAGLTKVVRSAELGMSSNLRRLAAPKLARHSAGRLCPPDVQASLRTVEDFEGPLTNICLSYESTHNGVVCSIFRNDSVSADEITFSDSSPRCNHRSSSQPTATSNRYGVVDIFAPKRAT
jgi:hypothetical protein